MLEKGLDILVLVGFVCEAAFCEAQSQEVLDNRAYQHQLHRTGAKGGFLERLSKHSVAEDRFEEVVPN